MRVRTIFVVFFILSAILSSCSGSRERVPASFLKPEAEGQEYRIHKGDVLDIKFFYNPELNDQVVVRPDGRISLQLAKEIAAEGLTPGQLTDALTSHYSTQLKNPEITIIVRSFSNQRVFVDGEVTRAGMVALVDPMTVLQAISQAGGIKESGAPGQVVLIRRAGNGYSTAKLNLAGAMDGEGILNDVTLLPNDIVLVPRSGIANLDLWVDQYVRRLIPFPIGIGLGLGY